MKAKFAACPGLILGYAARGAAQGKAATAVFAGGCFWCMEPPFDRLEGVISIYWRDHGQPHLRRGLEQYDWSCGGGQGAIRSRQGGL